MKITVHVNEFRPVKVQYEVEASSIQEALDKIENGDAGRPSVVSMPNMQDDPYEIDEQEYWQVSTGSRFEYVHDIGNIDLEKALNGSESNDVEEKLQC